MTNILFITELYYPEETSTGYILTGIAEGLAAKGESAVRVLCAQPTYSRLGEKALKEETRKGVRIRRLMAPSGDKNRLPERLWNVLSLSLRFAWVMMFEIKRGDRVLVVTNPPSLPLLAGWICRLKGAKPILIVHDVYPDVLVPIGLTKKGSILYRIIDRFQCHMLRRMDRIVVLGRDMEARIKEKFPGKTPPTRIIANWGDSDRIQPALREANRVRLENQLGGKFIIQFSGNMGRTHGLQDLVSLAERFEGDEDVHFLVFGWGAGRPWLEEMIEREDLKNVTLLDPCSKEELGMYLTCCDLFFLPFKAGMEGISVPSRMYNVMAAGNPILAICSRQSELAMVVEEEAIGWVSEPNDLDSMEAAIRAAISNPEELTQMRRRARAAVEAKYTRQQVVDQFAELLLCPANAGNASTK